MKVLALLAAAATSAALLVAAVQKIGTPDALRGTLARLGLAERIVSPIAAVVIVAELAVSIGLLFRPDSYWTHFAALGLATAFASAGVVALRREEPIPCSCFGATRTGYLGWMQVYVLAFAVALVALLRLGGVTAPATFASALMFASIAVTIAGRGAVLVWKERRAARADRRSAEEMYVWLPSH